MSRRGIYALVVLSWLAGLLFLAGLGWLLDHWVAPGAVKTVLNALLIGLAITLFGVTPREAFRVAVGKRQQGSASESRTES
jgi:F0F1-type ATP synthase assembly protein I